MSHPVAVCSLLGAPVALRAAVILPRLVSPPCAIFLGSCCVALKAALACAVLR